MIRLLRLLTCMDAALDPAVGLHGPRGCVGVTHMPSTLYGRLRKPLWLANIFFDSVRLASRLAVVSTAAA